MEQITLFLLIGQMLLHLIPSGGYEKYVRMIFRLMILLQLIVPVFSLVRGDLRQSVSEHLRQYEAEMERIGQQAEEELEEEIERFSGEMQYEIGEEMQEKREKMDDAEIPKIEIKQIGIEKKQGGEQIWQNDGNESNRN